MTKFTVEFRRRRLAVDYTFRELGELTGMSHAYFHHLENIPRRGLKLPAVVAWQISKLFNWPVDLMVLAILAEVK